MSAPPNHGRAMRSLLTIAQFSQAQRFFGNLYEAISKAPDRLAEQRNLAVPEGVPVTLRVLLQPGSPVRYYLPVGPVTVAAAVSALAVGWQDPERRRWLVASAVGTLGGAMATAYIVHQINVRLFFDSPAPPAAERDALLRRWYWLNTIRLTSTGVAWLSAHRARSTA